MAPRQPNHVFEALIREAGFSHAGLARRVNELGREQGLNLRYDKTSVARWMAGQRPRAHTPVLLAELFSRRLGRPVNAEDLGFPMPDPDGPSVGLQFAGGAAESVDIAARLWRSDVHRREFLLESTFTTTALLGPSRDWLVTPPDSSVARVGGPRVCWADVRAVEATGEMFRALDNRFGGGHARSALVQYLNTDVARLLRGSYPEEVGRGLFGAAADLTRLAGWMAYDTGRHGTAQRYFIQALRLSQAAGDRAFGGHVLATMSRQATYLGHGREAIQLARAALHGLTGSATPRARAVFHAVKARGHGLLGDDRACALALMAAEGELERARPGDHDPSWATFFDEAQLADEFGHSHRDLGQFRNAERFALRSLELRSERYVRSRAFCRTVLATAHVEQGELDEGCLVALGALELVHQMHSVRGIEYLRTFRERLDPHRRDPVVRAFDERARELLRPTA